MAWYGKEQTTPFDTADIEGLCYIDGDLLALLFKQNWTKGQKFLQIAFPSGVERDLWESTLENVGIVHLFGEIDLPLKDNRDRAYAQAMEIAEQVGYGVQKVGNDQLELWGHDRDEHYRVRYDNQKQRMVDVVQVKDSPEQRLPYRMPLLTDEIRARLPKLYSNERLGLDALAQVKFFTPDGNYTWYASEFDGDDTFFGLVIGHEIELGYFSMAELEGVRGSLGLPIERDRFFEPKTLRELKEQHRQA